MIDFSVLNGPRGSFAFDVKNPPQSGTKLVLKDARVVTFDEIGMGGMLVCTDCLGSQQLYFPHQIKGPFVEAYPLGDADLTHL